MLPKEIAVGEIRTLGSGFHFCLDSSSFFGQSRFSFILPGQACSNPFFGQRCGGNYV